jgi:phosphohistidine phosphatase
VNALNRLPIKTPDMKTLYLLRHAKSSWQNSDLDDFERPLLEKGLKRSKLMIDYLLEHEVGVDLIVSSPAVRALATAEIFARALNYPVENIRKEKKMYFGDSDSYYEQFFDVPKHVNSMILYPRWNSGHYHPWAERRAYGTHRGND